MCANTVCPELICTLGICPSLQVWPSSLETQQGLLGKVSKTLAHCCSSIADIFVCKANNKLALITLTSCCNVRSRGGWSSHPAHCQQMLLNNDKRMLGSTEMRCDSSGAQHRLPISHGKIIALQLLLKWGGKVSGRAFSEPGGSLEAEGAG